MHEMAINGDSKIQRDFLVYYNVEQYKSLNIINVQTVRTKDVERTFTIFGRCADAIIFDRCMLLFSY